LCGTCVRDEFLSDGVGNKFTVRVQN
jgi:hypothetical protein